MNVVFKQDSVLLEVNKCVLLFRQDSRSVCLSVKNKHCKKNLKVTYRYIIGHDWHSHHKTRTCIEFPRIYKGRLSISTSSTVILRKFEERKHEYTLSDWVDSSHHFYFCTLELLNGEQVKNCAKSIK